jgi:hypothetical protein
MNQPGYYCERCDYRSSRISEWNRHLTTRKHQKYASLNFKSTSSRIIDNIETLIANKLEIMTNKFGSITDTEQKLNQTPQKITAAKKQYICDTCDKFYTVKSSLWYHKQKCKAVEEEPIKLENKLTPDPLYLIPDAQQDNSNIIIELLKQNQELQKQIIEMAKEPKITTITNNNQFNLNMFLNENCKNALNIMDFVNSLDLSIADLEETGRLGYVNGISRIFINALKNMDITMRPIHCTDIKRETVYVKDKDTWEKDNEEKEKLRKVIDQVSRKNLKLLPEWQQQNPDFRHLDTPENKQFMKISLSSLGAEYEDDQVKMEKKILKNVMKEVVLEKMPA